jgi:glycosyltransferase involved in cell wall biosynthesis
VRVFLVCGDRGIPPAGAKGASVHLRALAQALSRAGHQLVTFSPRPGDFPTALVPLDGLSTVLDESARGGPPDVIYERYSLGHLAGLEAARALGRPLLLEVNAPLVAEASRHRPGSVAPGDEGIERRLFGEADLVLTVSEPLRRHVADLRGTDAGTVVVPNGCDPALFPLPARLDQARPTLVFLGHPRPWHGAERLPGLLAAVIEAGCPARLLIVGGGPGADVVADDACRRGLSHAVEVTGPLPQAEAARRLTEATVAVAPYPADPFFYFSPLKVVECMAAGLPVVTSDQGDLPRMLGGTGVLVAPDDEQALREAVLHLLRVDELRRCLGTAARARALRLFTWDRVAENVTALAEVCARAAA